MRIVQLSKTALVATVAAFFSLVSFGNITDYDANWQFVHHVLAMDTTFPDSELRWRAVTSPGVQTAAYWLIIGWQGVTAVVLWFGVARLLAARNAEAFRIAKPPAVVGLTLGSLLYGFGFVVVGGEWFAMWQSEQWNGQSKALLFLSMILAVLIVLLMPDTND
ncbi:MAG: DUF2165 domain-containing protein [Hyphomicrobiales bacterium]|nr:DUF2165 domain-containing protein [Hyphomicrobiales bacterium]